MQFFHYRKPTYKKDPFGFSIFQNGISAKGGQTIVMEELKSWFVNSLSEGEFFAKKVGKARCSDKENYNKKLGRELSLSRAKVVTLTVQKILILSNSKEVLLSDVEGNSYFIQVVLNDNQGNARFVSYIPKELR